MDTIQVTEYPTTDILQIRILWFDFDGLNGPGRWLYHGVRHFVHPDNIYVCSCKGSYSEHTPGFMFSGRPAVKQYDLSKALAKEFDICFISSVFEEIADPYLNMECNLLLNELKQRENYVLILMDPYDHSGTFPDYRTSFEQADMLFSRCIAKDCLYPPNVFPLPICSPLSSVSPFQLREHDVAFNANLSHGALRIEAHETLSKSDLKYKGNPCEFLEFIANLANSKIAIDIQQDSLDTIRFIQSLASGALVLKNKTKIVTQYPFIEDFHYASFECIDEMMDKLNYYLTHDKERLSMALAGQNFLNQYHTTQATAKYWFEMIKRFARLEHIRTLIDL